MSGTSSVGGSRPWKRIDVPAAVRAIPSMLSHEELQYLIWLGRDAASGWGAIVDLGPWLGSSTVALAEGTRARGGSRPVHSFDLFSWEPSYMERVAPERLEQGADFLPVFERLTAPWADRIEARKTDLHHATWSGGPIEILFVDAAKSWDLLNSILRTFGPHLEPGRSRVVLQDFRHFYTYWLPLVFAGQPELWTELESVQDGTTVTFVPGERLRDPASWAVAHGDDEFPFARAESILRARIAAETGDNRAHLRLALYYLALLRGEAGVRDELLAQLGHRDLLSLAGDARPRGDLAAALEALERGDLETASRLVERERSPLSAETLLVRGLLAQRRGHTESASRLFHDSLELLYRRPVTVPGWDAFAAGDYATTDRLVSEHVERHGESAEALFLLGRLAQERRQLDDAAGLFERALEHDPEHEATRRFRNRLELTRGFLAFEHGDLDAAQRVAASWVERHDDDAEAFFLLGRVAQQQHHPDRAGDLYSRALELAPADLYSRLFRADLAIAARRFDAAAADIEAAAELLAPGQEEPARMLCWLLHRLGAGTERRALIGTVVERIESTCGGLRELDSLRKLVVGARDPDPLSAP